MKRYIYAMSIPRKDALKRLDDLADNINDHVIECVVYKDVRSDTMSHWISEIANWLHIANKLNCSSRLKAKDYTTYLFGCMGTTAVDAEINLATYLARNSRLPKDQQYPDFQLNNKLIQRLFRTYQKLISTSVSILVSNKVLSVTEWHDILNAIL